VAEGKRQTKKEEKSEANDLSPAPFDWRAKRKAEKQKSRRRQRQWTTHTHVRQVHVCVCDSAADVAATCAAAEEHPISVALAKTYKNRQQMREIIFSSRKIKKKIVKNRVT